MRQFYRFKQLAPFVGSVSKSTIYRWIREGKFPAPDKLGGDFIACWSDEKIEAWQRGEVPHFNGTVSKQKTAARKKRGRPQLETTP